MSGSVGCLRLPNDLPLHDAFLTASGREQCFDASLGQMNAGLKLLKHSSKRRVARDGVNALTPLKTRQFTVFALSVLYFYDAEFELPRAGHV